MAGKITDDFDDDDLLDDLGDPMVGSQNEKKSEENKKSDNARSRLSKIFGKKDKADKQTSENDNTNGDDLLDNVPKVSMSGRKNIVVIGLVIVVFSYFVYAVTSHTPRKAKKTPENEKQEMTEEFRKDAKVPSAQKKTEEIEKEAEAIQKAQELSKDPLGAINIAAPPPPPPPTFDPGTIYAEKETNAAVAGNNLDENFDEEFDDEEFDDEEFDDEEFDDEDFEDVDDLESTKATGGSTSSVGNFPGSTNSGTTLINKNLSGTSSGTSLPQLGTATGTTTGVTGANGNVVAQDIQKQLSSSMFAGNSSPDILPDAVKQELEGKPATQNGILTIEPEQPYNLRNSTSFRRDVSKIDDLRNIILQGKVLDAVIETAINTDLPGKLRGIVSRDVYAENGKKILIPKGSRLIGTYDTQVKFGQARVYIVWTRVIRPDGIDAVLDSREDMIAVDLLGRSGVTGDIDNRFAEIFGSSLLLSTLTIAFAYAADVATNAGQITSTVTQDGNVVESGTNLSLGTRQAVSDLGSKVQSVARDLINLTPRITIDQGTRIKVFVNKDIRFPPGFGEREEDQGVLILR